MPTRILATVVAVIAMACIFVGTVIITGNVDDTTTPLVGTVLGFVSIVVTVLLTGKATNEKVDRILNGEMEGKIRRVLTQVLDERNRDV